VNIIAFGDDGYDGNGDDIDGKGIGNGDGIDG